MPEHLSIYGPSGSGKSYFMAYAATERARLRGTHAVMIATKKADRTLTNAGWPIINDWPPSYGQNQVIYWARGGLSDQQQDEQRARLRRIMSALWTPDSNKLVCWDELPYVCSDLGLRRQVTTYYREGRGLGITNVAVMQRPTDVSRYVHSEAGWLCAFAPGDQDDRERVAEVFGDRAYFRDVLAELSRERYEFLLQRKLTGETFISSLPAVTLRLPDQRRR